MTAAAVRFVRERAVQESDRPFCLVVGLVLPHAPYIAPRPLYDEYVGRVILPSVPAGARAAQHPAVRMWRQDKGFDEATPDQQRAARAGYYGMVTMVDEAVGQLVAALDETGLREQTAVFYTSDHGDMLGELGTVAQEHALRRLGRSTADCVLAGAVCERDHGGWPGQPH